MWHTHWMKLKCWWGQPIVFSLVALCLQKCTTFFSHFKLMFQCYIDHHRITCVSSSSLLCSRSTSCKLKMIHNSYDCASNIVYSIKSQNISKTYRYSCVAERRKFWFRPPNETIFLISHEPLSSTLFRALHFNYYQLSGAKTIIDHATSNS